jgi:hypothetical protein
MRTLLNRTCLLGASAAAGVAASQPTSLCGCGIAACINCSSLDSFGCLTAHHLDFLFFKNSVHHARAVVQPIGVLF